MIFAQIAETKIMYIA